MRFISPHAAFQKIVFHQQVEILASGQPRVVAPGFTAEFKAHDATVAEREQARRTFKYTGTVTDEGGRLIDPIDGQHRISTFDTATIDDPALRERVEKVLLDSPSLGREYVLADAPSRHEAPWPAYDKLVVHGQRKIEHVVEKIVAAITELGVDPDAVLAYERQEKDRPEVIQAVEALKTADDPADELVAA